jgi:hypothetical protein
MFDLFLSLIEDGTLDDARGVITINRTFWDLVAGVTDKSPERMCDILAAWLRRQLQLARETDASEHSISFKGGQFADKPIARAARSAPEYYIKCVLPVVVSISSWAAVSEESSLGKTDCGDI